ncbi:hypothetical protein BJ742DRAFT_830429 [Cladochytrium replicatum]|nr:hypothetical protein BJ742DRAFT_830429 [Cladochytrium replicatum]
MKVVAIVSGGKDSSHCLLHCVAHGHEIVALANLLPPSTSDKDELDSFMFQTVGHDAIELYAQCMELPLFRRELKRTSVAQEASYVPTEGDEVEDLFDLLAQVKVAMPEIEAVSSGAILSNYQRVRVENVCKRLGLTSLAYLWRRSQEELIEEMCSWNVEAMIVKVASIGLDESHLGKTLKDLKPHLMAMGQRYGINVCGEGGEFESLTLDMPLFRSRLVVTETQTIMHSNDAFAPVAYLKISKAHLGHKDETERKVALNKIIEEVKNFKHVPEEVVDREDVFEAFEQDGYEDADDDIHLRVEPFATPPMAPWKDRLEHPYFVFIEAPSTINSFSSTIEEDVASAMDSITDKLKSHNMSWDNAVLMFLTVSDMTKFNQVNTAYNRYFNVNPPPRVTVEVPLEAGTVQIECWAYASGNRDTMHVQSISYWAPSNIGPYSQSTAIGGQVFVSGQIGLIPATMELPVPKRKANELESLLLELRMSLANLLNVTYAHRGLSLSKHAASLICFVAKDSYVLPARTAWEQWLTREGIPQQVTSNSDQSDDDDYDDDDEDDELAAYNAQAVPACFVVVPALPKGAKVEWHTLLFDDPKNFHELSKSEAEPAEVIGRKFFDVSSSGVGDWKWSVKCSRWQRLCTAVASLSIQNENPLWPITVDELLLAARNVTSGLHRAMYSYAGIDWATEVVSIRVFYRSRILKQGLLSTIFESIVGSSHRDLFQTNASLSFIPVLGFGSSTQLLAIHAVGTVV